MDYLFQGTISTNSNRVDVKAFGMTGDGTTNDGPALVAALAYVKSLGGGILVFPKGTYNLPTWTTQTVDYPLTITGTEYSKVVGPAAVDFLSIVNNSFVVDTLSIDNFNNALLFTNSTQVIPFVKIRNVNFTNTKRAALYWGETNPGSGVTRMKLEDSTIKGLTTKPQYGAYLAIPQFDKLEIRNNTIDGIAERGIYVGSNTTSMQPNRKNIHVTRNNVGNIYNVYGSLAGQEDFYSTAGEGKRAANGIQIYGTNAVITENYVYNVDNYSKQDCEGIYTKCMYTIIARNHVYNSGGGEACIDVKGGSRANGKMADITPVTNANTMSLTNMVYGLEVGGKIDILDSAGNVKYAGRSVTAFTADYDTGTGTITISTTPVTTVAGDYIKITLQANGYGVIVKDNFIKYDAPYVAADIPGTPAPDSPQPFVVTGIKINSDDVKVSGNLIEGVTYQGIVIGGSSYNNIEISNNTIRKIRGFGGITVAGIGRNFMVTDNQISEVTTDYSSSTPFGISVSGSAKNVIIQGNQIDQILKVGIKSSSTCGIQVVPSTLAAIQNVTIRGNNIKDAGKGIEFRSQAADDIWVDGNKIQNVTTLINYSKNPTNFVMGSNNPTLSVPAPIDPSTVTGMYAWYDAAAITGLTDGAAVASWTDRSTQAATLIQDDPLARPSYIANALNGKAAVNFGGSHKLAMVLPSPTTAPVLGQSIKAGETLDDLTYYVAYAWKTALGTTLVGPEASITVTAGNQLDVTVPALPAGATAASVYMGTVSGTLYTQISTLTGTTYSRNTPIVTATAKPTANTAGVPWTVPMSQPNTIFIVAKLDSGYLFDGLNTANRTFLRNSSGFFYFSAGATATPSDQTISTPSNTSFRLFTLRANGIGTTSVLKVDSTSVTGDAVGVTPKALDGLTLGGLVSSGFAVGKVCEIIVYNASLSSYDQGQVEYYLKNKWAI